MNNIGELAQVDYLNILATLGGIATLVLCILKLNYNGVKSLKKAFYSMVVVEMIFISFMNYGAFQIAVACILSIVLFLELIILMSKYPNGRTTFLKWAFILMFVGGMSLYFYCNYKGLELPIDNTSKNNPLGWAKNASWGYKLFYVVISSVMDVGWMFYGRGNADIFFRLPIAKDPLYALVFWVLHFVAFLTFLSALFIRFGDSLLKWVRTKTQVSCVDLVFGINSDSIAFSRNIADTGDNMLVYVDSMISEDYEASIKNLGGLVYSGTDALEAKDSFLKEIHIDKKNVRKKNMRLRLYALSHDYDKNIQYAQRMSAALEKEGIPPEQTELVLLGANEEKGMLFQASKERYGYGSVISFDEYEMSARLLIHKYPLCNFINFDENGRATDNVEVLIVGFGRMGHEVLRSIIANGQFEGSNFQYTIFDPKYREREGFVKSQYPLMFANYEYRFEPQDGRSSEVFDFLKENASSLKYIVICIEDRDSARSMAIRMADRLHAMKYPQNVYTCDPKGIRCYSHSAQECETLSTYDSDLLYSGKLDMYAMELNHRYSGGKSIHDDWRQCAYFHRMSSRASVDYLIPLIRKITAGINTLTPPQKENLAKSEHLRWCAFHYTFGYDVMEIEEFTERLKKQQAEIQENGSSDIKPRQDTEAKKHVCLVSWDKLDEVSQAENSITHGNKDYKQNDRDNVDVVMELMQSEERGN